MAFDPFEYGYDPEVMAAQRELEKAQQPEDYDFASGFTGGFDLSTDKGRQAWATSGLSGLLLSKMYSDDAQKEWFIQRNAVDLGYNRLKDIIASYENVKAIRGLSSEEQAQYDEAVQRKALLEEDLAYVYDNFDGDMDATIDTEGKSFNDRWGIDIDEEADLSNLLGVFAENPAYAGGAITAEVIKDLPLLAVAKVLGIAHKGMNMGTLIAKVNAKLNGIESKVLRGLTKLSAGVGGGAVAGAIYEGIYSAAEQGEVKPGEVEIGAKFGGTFGLLGGLALMAKGPKVSGKFETVSSAVEVNTPREIRAVKQTEIIFEQSNAEVVTKSAEETSILPNTNHEVSSIKGHPQDRDPFLSTYNRDTNTVETTINEKALEKAQKDVLEQIHDALENNKDFRGVPSKNITGRDLENLSNPEVFKMYGLAHEKAKGEIVMAHQRQNMPIPEDVDAQAWQLALEEIRKIDAKRQEPNPMERADAQAQLTPEELEAERIIQARKAIPEVPEEPVTPPPAPRTPVADLIKKHPKAALGAGIAAGYMAAPESEKASGMVVGGLAVAAGPRAYKALTSKTLKASAMKVKVAMSKNIEQFSAEAKVLEFEMQEVLKEVKEVFNTPDLGLALISSLETGKRGNLTKAEWEVRNKVKAVLDLIGKEAVEAGVIRKDGDVGKVAFGKFKNTKEQGHFLNNYFPHLFKVDLSEEELQELVNVYLKESKSGLRRTMMGTIEDIMANPKFADRIITDPVAALDTYAKAMSRTIYGKNLINSMYNFDLSADGKRHLPAMMSIEAFKSLRKTEAKDGGLSDQEILHYTEFEHPTLKGFVAHSDVKPLLDDHFAVIRRGGIGEVMEGVLKLNNGLKRIFVFGSLFHAQALALSSMYSLGIGGFTKGLKRKGADGQELTLADLKIGSGEFRELAKEAIRDGLGIINIKKSDLVNPGFDNIEKLLAKGGIYGKNLNKVFEKLDYVTWEYFHDRFKLAAYLQKKQQLMDQGMSGEQAGKLSARFANDAYGGLDWNDFGTRLYNYAQNNPTKIRGILADKVAGLVPVNKRRWLNLGLFAPDWTISNLRIVANTFVHGYKYSDGLLKAIHRGDAAAWKSKEGKELAAAFKMYAQYTARAGLITSGMWYGMMQVNNALWENPEPTMDGLMDFWFGEDSGKMDLGGGESMVISKQISEPYHWIQHPRHTLLNKMSIVPKTVVEGMFNKQWFSLKKGFPMGPAITDPDGTSHYTKWLLGKGVPISMKPFIDEKLSFSEKMERFATGFFGFPQYGAYYDEDVTYELGEPVDYEL